MPHRHAIRSLIAEINSVRRRKRTLDLVVPEVGLLATLEKCNKTPQILQHDRVRTTRHDVRGEHVPWGLEGPVISRQSGPG